MAPRASGAGPTPIPIAKGAGPTLVFQKKLKLLGISALAFSILSSLFLVSTVRQSTFLLNSISAYTIAAIK